MRVAQLGHPGLQTAHGWPGRYGEGGWIQVSGQEGGVDKGEWVGGMVDTSEWVRGKVDVQCHLLTCASTNA